MATEHLYIPAAGKLFCADCNLISLAWNLMAKNSCLNSLGLRRRQVPGIVKAIAKQRKQVREISAGAVTLPAFGHICIRVHRGYKVFDFSARTATKIFDTGIAANAASDEIKAVHDAASLDFAPSLVAADPQHGWYTETFIPGKHSPKTERSTPEREYRDIIAGYLQQMILARPLRAVQLDTYLTELLASLTRQLTSYRADRQATDNIKDFIQQTATRLEAQRDDPVYLVLSHGDFSFVNFIYHDNGIAVIDWESLEDRSALNDLYNYFLTELYYARAGSDLMTGIDDAIVSLTRDLATANATLAANLADCKDVYRWLYYLERLSMLLDRDFSSSQLQVIQRSMDIFKNYESFFPDRREH